MRRARPFLTLASFALACAAAGGARAQTASEIARAQEWFRAGLAAERAASFSDALALFKRAQSVKRTPQLAFHVGVCEARVGQLVEARVDLERARDLARAASNARVADAAAAEIADLAPRVPRVRIAHKGALGAVSIDGATLAPSVAEDAIALDPGPHTVRVTLDGVDDEIAITLTDGESRTLAFEPKPRPAAPPAPPAQPAGEPVATAATAPSASGGGAPLLGWTLLAAGGAALGGAVAFWMVRTDAVTQLEAVCGPGGQSCPESARGTYDDGKRAEVTSAVLLGAGLVAAGAGVLVLTHRTERKTGWVTATPSVGRGEAGVVVRGGF